DWTFTVDNALVQQLAAGQVVTQTYTVTIADAAGTPATQVVTVTITGTNDAPVIAVEQGDSAAEGLAEANAGLAVSGTLSVADVDVINTVTPSVVSVTIGQGESDNGISNQTLLSFLSVDQGAVIDADETTGTINWSFNSGAQAFDYLAVGEALTLTYTIRATDDSTGTAGTDDQTVLITITGTNDGPVATADVANALTENDSVNSSVATASGSVLGNDTDADATDALTVVGVQAGAAAGPINGGVGTTIAGTYGSVVIAEDGSYTYTLDNNDLETQALSTGEQVTEVFSYTVEDEQGVKSTATLSIAINGSDDTIVGDGGNNLLSGTGGRDTIQGLGGNDTLDGLGGADLLQGGDGNDVLTGGAGADTLQGATGNDTGTDTAVYVTSGAGVTVDLATGTGTGGDADGDTLSGIENLLGSGHNDTLTGNSAANVLDGAGGSDRLDGGAGNDTLIGGAGADSLVGGTDSDWASYATAASGVQASLSAPGGNTGDAAGDTYAGIENLAGSSHNDVLIGDGNANVLDGSDGDDTLDGGAGGDSLIGGTGSDTASYGASGTGVAVDLEAGTATGGEAQGDSLSGIENVIGSTGNDALIGDSNANVLSGGAGSDNINGGAGNDTLDGGGDFDNLVYVNATAGVVIDLAAGTATSGTEVDSISNFEGVIASAFDDTITGSSANEDLSGEGGDDTIDGGGGTDAVSYFAAPGAVVVNLSTGTATGAAGSDSLSNIENARGGAFDDTITGTGAGNFLMGNGGDDTLNGGAGADQLDGGIGNDVLAFNTGDVGAGEMIDGGNGNDTIQIQTSTDFTAANTIQNVEAIELAAETSATFTGDQLQGFAGSLVGAGGTAEQVVVNVGPTGNDVDLSGLGFGPGWDSPDGDAIVVNGDGDANTIIGSSETDTLVGGGGADVLDGGIGNDVLLFNTGDVAAGETIDGGTGNDTILVQTSTDFTGAAAIQNVEVIALAAGTTATFTGDQGQAFTGTIEGAIGAAQKLAIIVGPTGDDVDLSGLNLGSGWDAGEGDAFAVTGDADANTIVGSGMTDSLLGEGGADVLNGGTGADSLFGGGGDDVLVFNTDDVEAGETIHGGTETDTILVESDTDFTAAASIVDVEVIALAENTTATFSGDQLDGFAGEIVGSEGTAETVSIDLSIGGNDVDLSNATFGTGWNPADDGDSVVVEGDEEANIVVGSSTQDTLNGNGGDDTLTGGTDDSLFGGEGSDRLIVGDADFALADGGDSQIGDDVLELVGTVNLSGLANLTNIELLDADNGAANTISFESQDVLQVSVDNQDVGGSGLGMLLIDTDINDTVVLGSAGDTWTAIDGDTEQGNGISPLNVGGTDYYIYQSDANPTAYVGIDQPNLAP
ncbi:MAG: VCBS domain-containing protein, partial [Alphaproteobacteria bacterium]|nr:VCBS domain-containing protein [Alphaproteobacteria bacterium]